MFGEELANRDEHDEALIHFQAAYENPAGINAAFAIAGFAEALGNLERIDEAWPLWQELAAFSEAPADLLVKAAYFASTSGHPVEAGKYLSTAASRSSGGSSSTHRLSGWTYLNLGDFVASRKSFEESRRALQDDESPDSDLLAGLAITQWLTGDQESAVTTGRELIQLGRTLEPPVDWGDPKTILDQDWPESETVPLKELLEATLSKNPELSKPALP